MRRTINSEAAAKDREKRVYKNKVDVLSVLISNKCMGKRTHNRGRDPELEFVISQAQVWGRPRTWYSPDN
jgi:hypothetical protein